MKIEIRSYYYIKNAFWKIVHDPLWYDGKDKLDRFIVDIFITAKTKPTCFPERGM
jgi:hypothetical protein